MVHFAHVARPERWEGSQPILDPKERATKVDQAFVAPGMPDAYRIEHEVC